MPDEGAPPAIAVVGMAGRFPGAANVRELWENLRSGVESISFFSEQEMVESGVPRSAFTAEGYVPARGVASGLDLFDAAFFGYTPREAELMDPQHRVFLECAFEALEDSGIDPERSEGLIGVYAGTSISTYLINNVVPLLGGLGAGAIQAALANDKDHVPTRVSYKLDLRGPSVNVQTACSTSLVAVHLACQSLLMGECDVALAGGAAVTVPLRGGYRFEEGSILSPDGHCRAFDRESRGTVGGSGVAIVVLKRLDDAVARGDTIHAVIRGSAINNDGALKVGYTAPSVEGQAEVVAQAQGIAEVDPDTVTYVEAHGTATPLGDPIEIAALTRAFRLGTERTRYCAIGSVKTNLGHMDAAAGVTGLIKAVLSLRHGEIPPSLHFSAPNPEIDFDSTPFFVNAELRPWDTGGLPRRAGVSSFGIGGTNAHVVLEEAPPSAPPSPSRPRQLIVLSARNDPALRSAAENLADHLARYPDTALADVAYTLQTGRRVFARREAVVACDTADAVVALRELARAGAATPEARPDRPVVFMFPGQGAQHPGMARGLYDSEPTFRGHVDHCAEILKPILGLDLRHVMYPANGHSPEASDRLTDTRFAQPALFTIQYALARLWMDWGVRPRAMIGHSIGEYAAACLAGVMGVEDALGLVATRGRLVAEQPSGSMLAVPLPEDRIQPYLREGISLAAVNQADQSVVSGPTEAIEELERALAAEGLEGRRLHTSHAFHSSMMDPALEPFRAAAADVELKAPGTPFISGVTGRWVAETDAVDPDYWARHLREPVRFAAGLEEILGSIEDAALLEVGPGQTLTALARRARRAAEVPVVPSLPRPRSDQDDLECHLEALGRLWVAGISIDWAAFYDRESRRKVSLPTYPFDRRRYWMDPGDAAGLTSSRRGDGKTSDIADWFYAPAWRPAVRSSTSSDELPRRWLVLGADVPALAAVLRYLDARGAAIVAVRAGSGFGRDATGRYTVDPADPDHYTRLLRDLESRGLAPDVVLHGWAAGSPPDAAPEAWTIESFSSEIDRNVHGLVHLARAVAEVRWSQPIRLAVVTAGAVDLPGDPPAFPARAAVLGVVKVIPQELPNLSAVCVDLDVRDAERWREPDVEAIVADLCSAQPEATTAYRRHRRLVEVFEPVRLEAPGAGSPLRRGGTYLIVGGLGGVGIEVARRLHDICGARLVLTTRREVTVDEKGHWWADASDAALEAALREVRAMQGRGVDVLLVRSDATRPDDMEAAFVEAERAFGTVHGAIFAAGAEKIPAPIAGATRGDLDAQIRPRALGVLALAAAVRTRSVDFCLVQSSLASVLGASGFVGYTAAHAFLDAFAAAQDDAGRTGWITIDWDNWITWKDREAGIERAAEFFMSEEEGGVALERALAIVGGVRRLVVSTGNLDARIRRWINPSAGGGDARSERGGEPARYERPELDEGYAAPTTDVEAALADVWGEVLGIDRVGIHDDFFELGGDSVLGIQVVAKARRLDIHLSPQQIFEHSTIARLASAAAAAPDPVLAEQGPVTGAAPLTPIQRWFFERDFPEPQHFNMPLLVEAEEVDAGTLEEALRHLVRHHDALRLRFDGGQDGWEQHHADVDDQVPVDVVDLSSVDDERLGEELASAAAVFQAGLDLERGPLFRAVVFRTGGSLPDRVLLVAHHLVVDAVSWRILLEDLGTAYEQLGRGEVVRLPNKTTSFKRWAEALQAHARTDGAGEEAQLWLSMATDEVPPLPEDIDDGPNTVQTTETVRVSLDVDETRTLIQDVPRAVAATLEEVLLAALAASVTSWTGWGAVRVAVEGHGREDIGTGIDLSRTIGWFTTLFPVRLDVRSVGSAEEALLAVKEAYRSVPKGGLGYGVLRYLTGSSEVARALSAAPHPEVSFLYLGRFERQDAGAGAFEVVRDSAGPVCAPGVVRPHLLEVLALVVDQRLHVEVGYSHARHTRTTAERLARGILDALREMSDRAGTHRGRLSAADFPASGLSQEQIEALVAGIDPQA